MKNYKIFQKYAKAWFRIAQERKIPLSTVVKEANRIKEIFEKYPKFITLLKYPSLNFEKKQQIFIQILNTLEIDDTTREIFLYLLKENLIENFPEILNVFSKLLDKHENKQEVLIETAYPIDEESLQRLKEILKKKLKKQVRLKIQEDKKIIGGLILKIDGKLIDGSIKYYLESLKERLKAQ